MDTQLVSVSRNTLYDLTVCARHVVGQAEGNAMIAIASAIREAEVEIKRVDAPAVNVPPEAIVAAPPAEALF